MKRKPKLREKLYIYGPQALADEELLAIILRTGYKNKSVLQLAKEVLEILPGKNIFESNIIQLKKIKGLGKSKISTILACGELVKRYYINQIKILCPKDAINCANEILTKRREHFMALYLNTKKALIAKEYISIGTLDATLVHPREVFAPAIEKRASSLIIIHNHPSGDSTPSEEDKKLTHKLKECADILGIELCDHIIVSENGYFSFREKNIL